MALSRLYLEHGRALFVHCKNHCLSTSQSLETNSPGTIGLGYTLSYLITRLVLGPFYEETFSEKVTSRSRPVCLSFVDLLGLDNLRFQVANLSQTC